MYNFPDDNRVCKKENISQVHAVLLRMIKVLDEICTTHQIDYWLEYGTLLGAIRHNGFIPWDNEADIGMLREDFENFIEASKSLPDDIFFQTRDTDVNYTYPSHFIEAKLRDKYSNYVDFSSRYPEAKWHNGIQVDIFVYDFDDELEDCLTNSFERYIGKRKVYLKEQEIQQTVLHPFEDMMCPVPVGFDDYLKRSYGDYMQFPPEREQIPVYVEVTSPCNHKEILNWKDTQGL